MKRIAHAILSMSAALLALPALAQDKPVSDQGQMNPQPAAKAFPKRGFSPYASPNYATRVFWGDQHVHTGWSADAGAFGCTLGPDEALRFARGEQVMSSLGEPANLSRPLDWAVIADHSDAAGVIFEIKDGNPGLMADPQVKKWHDMMASGQGVEAASEMIAAQSNNRIPPAMKDPKLALSIWQKNTAIMEKYNEPGRFTAFIGYEWTSNAGGGDNLHRNVIYRDGKDKADQAIPMTTFDSENPEDLWKWMAAWEAKTGGSLLAIPHNGNLSNGKMFALQTFLGNPLTREWAETRAKWEPIYEITQIKGDGETQPSLSPTDEFANFEKWDKANLAGVPKKQPVLVDPETDQLSPIEHQGARGLLDGDDPRGVFATQDARGQGRGPLAEHVVLDEVPAHDPVPKPRAGGPVDRRVGRAGDPADDVAWNHRLTRGIGAEVADDHDTALGQAGHALELLVQGQARERKGLEPRGAGLDEPPHEERRFPVRGRRPPYDDDALRVGVKVDGHADRPLVFEDQERSGHVRRRAQRKGAAASHLGEDHRHSGEQDRAVVQHVAQRLESVHHHHFDAAARVLLDQEICEEATVGGVLVVGQIEVLDVEVDRRADALLRAPRGNSPRPSPRRAMCSAGRRGRRPTAAWAYRPRSPGAPRPSAQRQRPHGQARRWPDAGPLGVSVVW